MVTRLEARLKNKKVKEVNWLWLNNKTRNCITSLFIKLCGPGTNAVNHLLYRTSCCRRLPSSIMCSTCATCPASGRACWGRLPMWWPPATPSWLCGATSAAGSYRTGGSLQAPTNHLYYAQILNWFTCSCICFSIFTLFFLSTEHCNFSTTTKENLSWLFLPYQLIKRVTRCRFTALKDVKWFEDSLVSLAQQDLGPQVTKKITHTNYFVDFLR